MKNFILISILVLGITGVIFSAMQAGGSMASQTRSNIRASITNSIVLPHEMAMLDNPVILTDSLFTVR